MFFWRVKNIFGPKLFQENLKLHIEYVAKSLFHLTNAVNLSRQVQILIIKFWIFFVWNIFSVKTSYSI